MTQAKVRTKAKIYLTCFPGGFSNGDVIGQALAEDGEGLASHLSSNESWAKHDMGLRGDRKHEIYKEHYPDGYELVWIDDPSTDSRWQAALTLNRANHKEPE